MPTYIDCHPLAAIPSAVQHQIHGEATRGVVDQHGAQPLAHWVIDGVIDCIVQAPSEEAVCQHHAARGWRATSFTRSRGCAAATPSQQKRRSSCVPHWLSSGRP